MSESYEKTYDEFMEVAKATSPGRNKKTASARLSDALNEKESGHLANLNKLVQYTANGRGYVPVCGTVPTLPPAIYSVEISSDVLTLVPRPLTTDRLLRLPDSKSDEVIGEIERFWTLKDTFQHYGFTHKRGFLLWGPPGGGKTATITLVVNQMVANGGVVINADISPRFMARMLADFRQVEPERPVVVVLEDIDTIIDNHGETDTLSLLDGEKSINNVCYLASTNYPEKLDGRVINRPSRFDRIVKIDMPNAAARRVYFESRNLPITPEEMNRWIEASEGLSIAHLKELIVGCLCFGNPFESEVKRLRAMAKTPRSDDGRGGAGFGR